MKEDLNFLNGRQPQLFSKWKTTLMFSNGAGRRPQKKIMQPYAIEYKTMVVAPLQVT